MLRIVASWFSQPPSHLSAYFELCSETILLPRSTYGLINFLSVLNLLYYEEADFIPFPDFEQFNDIRVILIKKNIFYCELTNTRKSLISF